MRYEQYEEKVQKAVKVRDFFYRFRLLFGAIVTVLIAFGVIIFNVKGIVKDSLPIGVSYVYGQPFEFESSGLLGAKVNYEFASYPDGLWSEEQPKNVGKYQMRAVSQNNYGKPTYGQVQTFEITPLKTTLTIETTQMPYGNVPELNYQLISGDTLSGIRYDVDDVSLSSPTYTLDIDSLQVTDDEGQDVTSNYEFTCESKQIQLKTRILQIQMGSNSKVYDGETLTENGYTIVSGSLVDGDSFLNDVTSSSSVTDCTSSAVKNEGVAPVIVNSEGVDVTSHYSIEILPGTLSISKRPLIITSSNFTKCYDGNPVTDEERSLSVDGLLSQHKIVPTWKKSGLITEVKDSTINDFDYVIVDQDGKDKTNNYEVTKVTGKITIEKKPITVDINKRTYFYSDSLSEMNHILGEDEYTVDDVANGENVKVSLRVQGSQETTLTSSVNVTVTKSSEDGAVIDTTDNYDITITPNGSQGGYEFKRHSVLVQASGAEITYDGEYHQYSSYSVSLDGTEIGENITDFDVPGYHLEVTGFASYRNVVENQENLPSVRILDENDNDCSSRFDLTVNPGVIQIKKREMGIQLPVSISQYFDENSYGFNASYFAVPLSINPNFELAPGDRLVIDDTCLKKISKPNESFKIVKDQTDIQDADHDVVFSFSVLNSDNVDVTDNYDIVVSYPEGQTSSDVTIHKRKLALGFSVDSVTKWYDGKVFDLATLQDKIVMENHPDIPGYGAYEGSGLTVEILKNQTTIDFGTSFGDSRSLTDILSTLDPSSYLRVMNGNRDVTDYFDITVTSFPTVYFRQVKLVFAVTSEDHVYDSVTFTEPSSSSGVELTSESDYPTDGDLSYSVSGSGKNVGTYSIEALSASLEEANGNVIGKEFMDISFSGKHSFDITKKELSIHLPSFVYWKNSTSPLSLSDFQEHLEINGLAGQDQVRLKLRTGAVLPSEMGMYAISDFLDFEIVSGNEVVTDNYEITFDFGNVYYKKVSLVLHYNTTTADVAMYDSTKQKIDYSSSNFYAEDYVANGETEEEILANMTRPDNGNVTVKVDPSSEYGLDVGSYRIRLKDVVLVTNDGKSYSCSSGDLDYAYDESESPTLTIQKKTPFRVNFQATKKHVYDGRSICFDQGISSSDGNRYSYYSKVTLSDSSITDIPVITLKEGVSEGPKECGTYTLNDYFEVKMYRGSGSSLQDVTDNYELTYDLGSVTIDKLNFEVSLDDWESYWDPDTDDIPSPSVECTNLEEFDYSDDGLSNRFSATYECSEENYLDVGEHTYRLSSLTLQHDSFSLVENKEHHYFNVTSSDSTHTVLENIPEIEIPEVTIALYELNQYSFDVVEGTDYEGNKLYYCVTLNSVPTVVGDYTENDLDYEVEVFSESGLYTHVENRYQGFDVKLTVHITKPTIHFRANQNSTIYDGTEKQSSYIVTGVDGAYSQDSFGFTVNLKQTLVGSYYDIEKEVILLTSNQTGHTYTADEFDFVYDETSPYLVIQKRNLYVTVKSEAFYYSGYDYSESLFDCVLYSGNVSGDKVSFGLTLYQVDGDTRTTVTEMKDIGTYEVHVTNITVRNSSGTDVTGCYNIIVNNQSQFVIYQF